MSELSGAQADWPGACTAAGKAIAAAASASDQQQQLALSGALLQVRALLAAGSDSEASAAAATAAAAGAGAHPLPAALQMLAQLAASSPIAAEGLPEQLLQASGSSGAPDVLQATRAKLAGDALLLQGHSEQAAEAYQRASDTAAAAAAAGDAAAEAGSDAGLLSCRFAHEVEADASLGLAQVRGCCDGGSA